MRVFVLLLLAVMLVSVVGCVKVPEETIVAMQESRAMNRTYVAFSDAALFTAYEDCLFQREAHARTIYKYELLLAAKDGSVAVDKAQALFDGYIEAINLARAELKEIQASLAKSKLTADQIDELNGMALEWATANRADVKDVLNAITRIKGIIGGK